MLNAYCVNVGLKKHRTWQTLNLLTFADSSTNTKKSQKSLEEEKNKAFFGPFRQTMGFLCGLPIFLCSLVTLVTFSSNLVNFKKKYIFKQIQKTKQKRTKKYIFMYIY